MYSQGAAERWLKDEKTASSRSIFFITIHSCQCSMLQFYYLGLGRSLLVHTQLYIHSPTDLLFSYPLPGSTQLFPYNVCKMPPSLCTTFHSCAARSVTQARGFQCCYHSGDGSHCCRWQCWVLWFNISL